MKNRHLTIAVCMAALLPVARTPAQSNVPPNNVTAVVRASIACGLASLKGRCLRGYDGLPVFPCNISRASGRANTVPRWGEGFIGNNAIVLLAMRKAGAPANDPVVAKLARRLADLVETYGLPDTTWDVMWLGAALANMPGDEYAELREQALGKLMDGQVDGGEARGLWGPVCINPKILSEIIKLETSFEARVKGAEESGKQPDAKQLATRKLLRTFKRVSTGQGDRLAKVTQNCDITPDGAPPITVQGLPYSFYSQTFADLETTAYALFALREARRNGVLPERSWRPKGKTARLSIPPIKASLVIEQAVTALSSSRKSDGSWDERNVHQPQEEFEEESYGRLPAELLLKLPSRMSPTTTAQGLTAIRDGLEAAGTGGRLTIESYRTELERALTVIGQQLDGFMATAANPSADEKSVAPWNTFFSLRGIHHALSVPELVDVDLWRRLACFVVSHQNKDGSWGVGRPVRQGRTVAPHPQASTALLAWRRQFESKQTALPDAQRRKLDFAAMDMVRTQAWLGSDYGGLRPIATAYAMMFLVEGVRPPVAGYLKVKEMKRPPPTLTRAVTYLGEEAEAPLFFQRLNIPPRKAELDRLPVIVIPGTSPLEDPETKQLLKEYIAAGNMLFVELYDSMQMYPERRKVAGLVPNGRLRRLPASSPFLADFKGAKPQLEVARTREEECFAIFLQLEAANGKGQSGAIPVSKAAQTVYLLIKQRMDPAVLRKDYLDDIPDLADPLKAREAALRELGVK